MLKPAKIYRYLTIITIIVFFVIFLYLLSQKIVLGPSLTHEVYFDNENKFVHGFFPESRVELIRNKENAYSKVNHEPVYLTAYSPRKFSKAEVEISYKKPEAQYAEFGVKLNFGEWAFYMYELPATESSFRTEYLSFDLTKAEIIDNKVKFMLAAPGIDKFEEGIEVDYIKIKLFK